MGSASANIRSSSIHLLGAVDEKGRQRCQYWTNYDGAVSGKPPEPIALPFGCVITSTPWPSQSDTEHLLLARPSPWKRTHREALESRSFPHPDPNPTLPVCLRSGVPLTDQGYGSCFVWDL